jgi:hypothetical protein
MKNCAAGKGLKDVLRRYLEIECNPVEAPLVAKDKDNEPHGVFVCKYSVVWTRCCGHDDKYSGFPTIGMTSLPSF